jgi:hypothetical protein
LISEKIEDFEETQLKRELQFNVVLSIKIDMETHRKLEQIGLYERKKTSTLARDILIEKLHVYERNPAFKRFLKQLEEKKGPLGSSLTYGATSPRPLFG